MFFINKEQTLCQSEKPFLSDVYELRENELLEVCNSATGSRRHRRLECPKILQAALAS